MPEARLERTRNPKPEIPPCVRLGHEMRYDILSDKSVCTRCRLTLTLDRTRKGDNATTQG